MLVPCISRPARLGRNAMTRKKKRLQDHSVEFDRAVAAELSAFEVDGTETYGEAKERCEAYLEKLETAGPRMSRALKSMEHGLARSAGLAKKPPSVMRTLCDEFDKKFPKDIGRFKRGEPLSDARLLDMVVSVTGKKKSPRELNSLRRQLVRQFREGRKASEVKRSPPSPERPVARKLDVRHGAIFHAPAPDILDMFPNLRRLKRTK